MGNVTINQHYVWRHYLEAWATPKKIWCKRTDKGEPFDVIPKKVGVERFFYEFFELSELDLRYIEGVIRQSKDERLQAINRGWLESFQTSFAMRRELSDTSTSPEHRKKLESRLSEIERTMGETFHFHIEDRALPILNDLRKKDLGFLSDQKAWVDFVFYLCNQYFRTAKLRNAMLSIPNLIGHDVKRTWPIEAFIYASNLGASFARQKSSYRIVFLNNHSDVSFIASDQPVINLFGSSDPEVDLYYPLKPNLAMIYTANPSRYGAENVELGRCGVESYNHRLYAHSDTQIYGNDPTYLKELSQLPKNLIA